MSRVWVIDTETSNNGVWKPEPGGHIVEFGAVAVDLESGRLGNSYSAIICDKKADPEAWVFKHTDLDIMDVLRGTDPTDFAEYMAKRLNGETVTAYNVAFDRLMIRRDMPMLDEFVHWGPCLMETASMIEAIPRKHAGQNIYPTAEATYNYLCPDDPCNLGGREKHRALDDAKMEAHILMRLYERGLYSAGVVA